MTSASLAFGLALLTSSGQTAPPPPINTLQEIGPALTACWKPPSAVQNYEVTIRLSFKRSGEVLGKPMITFSQFSGDTADQKRILASILAGLAECTPLNLSPGLGGAVAGRIFTLRYAPP